MKHALGWVSLSLILFASPAPAWAAGEPQETTQKDAAQKDAAPAGPAPLESNAPDSIAPEPASPSPLDEDAPESEVTGPEVTGPEATGPEATGPEATGPDAPDLGPQVSSKVELTPEEKAEKDARKACKIEICDVVATRERLGPDIACDVKKSWRAGDLTKLLGDQIGWPWGNAVCRSALKLERAALAEAMRAPKATIRMETQTVSCALQREGGEPYVIEVELAPDVTFENGKAVSATVNWGDVSAPLIIYPILYAGTGLDNQSNVLGPQVVKMVNAFTAKSCAGVKDELPGRRVN